MHRCNNIIAMRVHMLCMHDNQRGWGLGASLSDDLFHSSKEVVIVHVSSAVEPARITHDYSYLHSKTNTLLVL